jgi:hypothetical protein
MHKSLTPLKEGGLLLQQPAILLAQEPHLRILDRTAKKENQIKVPSNMGNNILYYKGEEARACIYASGGLCVLPCPDWSSRDIAAAIWIEDKKHILLVSMYLDGLENVATNLQKLEPIIKYANDRDLFLVMQIDSNAHHGMWGSDNDNERGQDLLEYILANDLTILNDNDKPTFRRLNQGVFSNIDVTIANDRGTALVTSWDSNFVTESNHALITMPIALTVDDLRAYDSKTTKWKYVRKELRQVKTRPIGRASKRTIHQIKQINGLKQH